MKTAKSVKKTARVFYFLSILTAGLLAFSCGGKKNITVAIVQHMSHTSLNQINETIVADLQKEFGDGLTIIQKNANGTISNLAEIYTSLIAGGVDYVIPIATPAAMQAKVAFADAGRQTPIIFSACSAPVASGLVTSLEKAPETITGVVNMIPADKIIDLALQIQPQLKRIGIINNTGESNSAASVELAKKHLDALGIAYVQKTISSTAELESAVSSIADSVDAFFTPNDNMVASAMSTYTAVAYARGKPIYCGADSMLADGGFATIGISYIDLGHRTAKIVTDLVKKNKTMPQSKIDVVDNFYVMLNMQTAQKLGLINLIPREVLEDAATKIVVDESGASRFGTF